MTRRSIDLHSATDPAWVDYILQHFDAFLQDHANCERKASALAMSLVVKHPDRRAMIPTLITLAQEELEHFTDVYALLDARGPRWSGRPVARSATYNLLASRDGRSASEDRPGSRRSREYYHHRALCTPHARSPARSGRGA